MIERVNKAKVKVIKAKVELMIAEEKYTLRVNKEERETLREVVSSYTGLKDDNEELLKQLRRKAKEEGVINSELIQAMIKYKADTAHVLDFDSEIEIKGKKYPGIILLEHSDDPYVKKLLEDLK
jgi:hypothetical protein